MFVPHILSCKPPSHTLRLSAALGKKATYALGMFMKPETWRVSADAAIEHFEQEGYSYSKEKLLDFDAYDSGLVHESRGLELKALYDAALIKIIEGSVEFAVYDSKTKEYRVVALSRDDFESWLAGWQYDDDLVVLSQNKTISVFHHSGFVFPFKSNN